MTPKRCFFPRIELDSASYARSIAKGSKVSEKTDDDIEDLYRIAMEEDEEWYNNFMKNVLGEEVQSINTKSSAYPSEKAIKNENSATSLSEQVVKNQENEPFKSSQNDVTLEEKMSKNTDTVKRKAPSMESDKAGERDVAARGEKRGKRSDNNGNTDERVFVQYMGIDGYETRRDVQDVTSLGYSRAEIAMLRADALDLILEDQIPIPKSGVPILWTVRDRREREVKMVKKKTSDSPSSQSGGRRLNRDHQNRSEPSRVTSRSSRDRRSIKSRVRSRGSKRSRQSNEASESVWMDLETFKSKLRKEAELRLIILGPDWEELVKGESNWRLNLYKKWLMLVDEGIGGDPFEDISYAPSREATKSSAKKRSRGRRTLKSRGMKSEKSRRYDTEEEYGRYAKTSATGRDRLGNGDSLSRRPSRSRENRLQREGRIDDIYSNLTPPQVNNRRGVPRRTSNRNDSLDENRASSGGVPSRRTSNRSDALNENRASSERKMRRQRTSRGSVDRFDQPRDGHNKSSIRERVTTTRKPDETDGLGKRRIEMFSTDEEICTDFEIE